MDGNGSIDYAEFARIISADDICSLRNTLSNNPDTVATYTKTTGLIKKKFREGAAQMRPGVTKEQVNEAAKAFKDELEEKSAAMAALEAENAELRAQLAAAAANSGDADPLFLWAIRSGPANITSMYNFGPTAEVTINPDAGSGDTVQVQVTADDPSSTDTPQSTVVTIVVN